MSVFEVTKAELETLGALDTVEGQGALALARSLDTGRNAMAKQGDLRELKLTMQFLRGQTVRVDDTVDEVRRQRDVKLKRAAASG